MAGVRSMRSMNLPTSVEERVKWHFEHDCLDTDDGILSDDES